MLYNENNTNEKLEELLKLSLQKDDDYEEEIKRLENLKEKLHTKEVADYFECLEEIQKLEEEKSNKERNIWKECRHNLFFLKTTDYNYKPSAILECACCSERILVSDINRLKKLYTSNKMISGYDKREKIPFIEVKKYLGNDAKYIIETKYLEICSQIVELTEALKRGGFNEYIYLVKSPEEVTANFFKEKFNNLQINNKPKYLSINAKRKYL